MPALQALLERSSDYFHLIEGRPPKPDDAINLAHECPPGWSLNGKFLIGIKDQYNHLVAVLEGMRGYPRQGIFWIGLLLIDPSKRGQGLGARIVAGFEQWARSQGAKQIRLGVVDVNERAFRFWQRVGFELVNNKRSSYLGQQERLVYQMKKKV